MLRADLAERGGKAVVPPKANRTGAVECGREMYKWHHLVENCFRNINHAIHYEKTDSSYSGMICGVGPA